MKIEITRGVLPQVVLVFSIVSIVYVLNLFVKSFVFELKHTLPVFVSHVEIPRFLNKIGAQTMLQSNVGDGKLAYYYMTNWSSMKTFYGIQYVKSDRLLEQQKIPYPKFTVDAMQRNQTVMRQMTKFIFDKFGDRAVLISDLPDQVAKEFDDYSLDFIQINYNHQENYCTIMTYLELYWPKLSYGGLMMVNWLVHDESNKKELLADRPLTVSVCSNSSNKEPHENTVEAVTLDFLAKVKVRHYQRLQTDDAIYFRKYLPSN